MSADLDRSIAIDVLGWDVCKETRKVKMPGVGWVTPGREFRPSKDANQTFDLIRLWENARGKEVIIELRDGEWLVNLDGLVYSDYSFPQAVCRALLGFPPQPSHKKHREKLKRDQ